MDKPASRCLHHVIKTRLIRRSSRLAPRVKRGHCPLSYATVFSHLFTSPLALPWVFTSGFSSVSCSFPHYASFLWIHLSMQARCRGAPQGDWQSPAESRDHGPRRMVSWDSCCVKCISDVLLIDQQVGGHVARFLVVPYAVHSTIIDWRIIICW